MGGAEARQERMTSGVPSDPDAAFVRVNDVAKVYDTGRTTIEAIARQTSGGQGAVRRRSRAQRVREKHAS